jgi:hypothetical protein
LALSQFDQRFDIRGQGAPQVYNKIGVLGRYLCIASPHTLETTLIDQKASRISIGALENRATAWIRRLALSATLRILRCSPHNLLGASWPQRQRSVENNRPLCAILLLEPASPVAKLHIGCGQLVHGTVGL